MYTAQAQSVTNTFFFTEYEYRILFGFQKSPNTKYQRLFGIEKIRIPYTEYYSVLRKSEYRMRIVLFGLTFQIPNSIPNFGRKKGNQNQHICLIQDI